MILKTVHNYTINSEKTDKCPSEYPHIFFIVTLIINIIGFGYGLYIESAVVCMFFMCLPFVAMFFMPLINDELKTCGVKIFMCDTESDVKFYPKYYPFTGNPDVDAQKITEIVNKYELTANQLYNKEQERVERERTKKEQSDACCAQYHDVMGRVKKND